MKRLETVEQRFHTILISFEPKENVDTFIEKMIHVLMDEGNLTIEKL